MWLCVEGFNNPQITTGQTRCLIDKIRVSEYKFEIDGDESNGWNAERAVHVVLIDNVVSTQYHQYAPITVVVPISFRLSNTSYRYMWHVSTGLSVLSGYVWYDENLFHVVMFLVFAVQVYYP